MALSSQSSYHWGTAARARGRSGSRTAGQALRQLDLTLILIVLALCVAGTFAVYAASYGLNRSGKLAMHYLTREAINIGLGLILAAVAAKIDYRQWRAYAPVLYGLTLLALLAVLSPIGGTVNGAHAWFSFGSFQLEPSEFVKVVLIVLVGAVLTEKRDDSEYPSHRDISLALGLAAVPMLLILAEPALGIAIVVAVIVFGVLALAGSSKRWLVGLFLVTTLGGAGIVSFHLLKPYQQARFTSFIHPQADHSGVAFQTNQGEIAIGSGGLFGQGFLQGSQTNGRFIPEQQTDFAYTVIGEETGLVGAGTVLLLLGALSTRALGIAARSPDAYGRVLAGGIGVWFGVQSFVNIGMTMGIMPVTGIPLPFVSYGGSTMFANMIAVGLLLSVARQSRLTRSPLAAFNT